jgi:hypothetical protein
MIFNKQLLAAIFIAAINLSYTTYAMASDVSPSRQRPEPIQLDAQKIIEAVEANPITIGVKILLFKTHNMNCRANESGLTFINDNTYSLKYNCGTGLYWSSFTVSGPLYIHLEKDNISISIQVVNISDIEPPHDG